MIISCTCGARLKVSDEKLTVAGVKLKCPKCGTLHVARKEAAAPPAAQELVGSSPAQAPRASASPEPSMPWFAPADPTAQQGTLVLIAHDSTVVADMISGALQEAGFATDYAPNGLEALKKAMELKPQAMVVDVGLTGIYGFELCERLKSDKATAQIKIVLLSSVYGLTAYKRSPVTLYGADDYIEKHHIPDQLVPKIRSLLEGGEAAPSQERIPASGSAEESDPERPTKPLAPLMSRKGMVQQAAPARQEPPPAASSETVSVPQPPAQEPARSFDIPEIPSIFPKTPVTLGGSPAAGGVASPAAAESGPAENDRAMFADESVKLDADFFEHEEYDAPARPQAATTAADPAEIEKARRFARLIVSDIALYNQDAVTEGIKNGSFFDVLKDDIAEGRTLYESRVPAPVRSGTDYLQEAFENFIASKKKLH